MEQSSMVLEKREEVKKIFEDFLDDSLLRIILSNPAFKDGAGPCKALKVRVRPVMLKGGMVFQAEELTEKQAFHRNLTREEGVSYLLGLMESGFKQAEVESSRGQARVLVGKKGTVSIKVKKNQQKMVAAPNVASHNRQKRYILEEGKPVAFLEDLGVMTADGKVVVPTTISSARSTVFWNLLRTFSQDWTRAGKM